jgi:ATP-dependent Clp endopeptidase proteolytic subunit ClpP
MSDEPTGDMILIETAEDAMNMAKAEMYAAQAREADAKARSAELTVAKMEHEAEKQAASNAENWVLHFEHSVRDTQPVREKLDTWHRLDPEAPWTIVMNSPGGSVIDGMALFDHLAAHSLRGGGTHHLTIICRGYAASMAGILAQAADDRVCGPESYLMLHKVSTITGGSLDDIEDEVEFLKMITTRVEDIFVNRSGGKLTRATLRRKWARRDWWVSSQDALKYGLVDRIG